MKAMQRYRDRQTGSVYVVSAVDVLDHTVTFYREVDPDVPFELRTWQFEERFVEAPLTSPLMSKPKAQRPVQCSRRSKSGTLPLPRIIEILTDGPKTTQEVICISGQQREAVKYRLYCERSKGHIETDWRDQQPGIQGPRKILSWRLPSSQVSA